MRRFHLIAHCRGQTCVRKSTGSKSKVTSARLSSYESEDLGEESNEILSRGYFASSTLARDRQQAGSLTPPQSMMASAHNDKTLRC